MTNTTNTNFWQRYYSLPKLITIIAVMLAVTGIAYIYASSDISGFSMTQEELQNITNENLKHVMPYMVFFIWAALLRTTISGIVIYLFCMFNPKRYHKKTQI